MTYGIGRRAVTALGPSAPHYCAGKQPWRTLPTECRMALVERALQPPANDLIDPFPLAL